jgi:hypothetical protein
MARKRATKVNAIKTEREAKSVRLDLSMHDHERLERIAGRIGLNKASYCRMAVLKQLAADEREAKE